MIITRAIDNLEVGEFFNPAQGSSVNLRKSAYMLHTLKVKIVLKIDSFHKERLN